MQAIDRGAATIEAYGCDDDLQRKADAMDMAVASNRFAARFVLASHLIERILE